MRISKLKNILFFSILLCILFMGKIVYAEETVDSTYVYKIEKLDLTGVNIQKTKSDTTTIGEIISSSVSMYQEPIVTWNAKKTMATIKAGKITVVVNTDAVDAKSYYMPAISEDKFQISSPTNALFESKTSESKMSFYKTSTLTAMKSPIGIAAWKYGTVNYYTTYDLEIINNTNTDFIPYSSGKYINIANWDISLNEKQFIIKSSTYKNDIGKFALQKNVQLPLGKKIEILEPQATDTDTAIDLRTDRKIRVTNADGSVSHDYTLHVVMPWKELP